MPFGFGGNRIQPIVQNCPMASSNQDADLSVNGPSLGPRSASYIAGVSGTHDAASDTKPQQRQSTAKGSEREPVSRMWTTEELESKFTDPAAFDARYKELMEVLNTNVGEVLPGTNLKCTTADVYRAGHEMMRLLSVEPLGIGFSWSNLSVTVPVEDSRGIGTASSVLYDAVMKPVKMCGQHKQATKKVVEGLTGSVAPGETLLIIGPPGSGCSTLMKIFAGRYDSNKVQVNGELYYNEHDCSSSATKSCKRPPPEILHKIGFCYEDDTHVPELTVAKTLGFVSSLGFPRNINNKGTLENEHYVKDRTVIPKMVMKQTMAELGIIGVADTVVGDELLRGVSGGQKKRVTIGEVMTARNSLLFLDGYTKGLDSATAFGLAKSIRDNCREFQGTQTVICTQYQASQEIFEVFDKVMVLQKDENGGPSRCVYFGKSDPDICSEYFSSIGYPKPHMWSWPDFLGTIGFSSGRRRVSSGTSSNSPLTPASFAEQFDKSKYGAEARADVDKKQHLCLSKDLAAVTGLDHFEHRRRSAYWESVEAHRYPLDFLSQLKLNFGREFLLITKTPRKKVILSSWGSSVMLGLMMGFTFFQLEDNFDEQFNRQALLTVVNILVSVAVANIISQLISDRNVMYRHTRNNLYRGSAFFLAKAIVDWPVAMVNSLIITALIPNLAAFNMHGMRWFYFWLNHWVFSIANIAIYRALVMAGSDIFGATMLLVIGSNIYTSLDGFQIPQVEMGWYIRWVTYINPCAYSFIGFALNEWEDAVITDAPYPNGTVTGAVYVKEELKIDHDFSFKWVCVAINAALCLLYLGVGCLVCEFIRWDDGHSSVTFAEHSDNRIQRKVFGKVKEVRRKASALVHAVSDRVSRRSTVVGHQSSTTTAVDELDQIPEDQVATSFSEDGVPSESFSAYDRSQSDVPPVYFSFEDISYVVDVDKTEDNSEGKKQLLTEVNGYCEPGMMIALMGTSGAGKTTLLDVLAQKKTGGEITGKILVNGHPQDEDFSHIVGYVEQTDNHVPRATIREAFTFAARLRRSPKDSDDKIQEVVDDVISQLGLDGLADAMIGTPEGAGSGVSRETLKRITIGVELVAEPSILFMDEPTSGLDAKGALTVVNVARNIADSGRTVICTIHQPSQIVIETFDYMLLLQRGGRTVYFGEIGEHSSILIDYFQSNGAPPPQEHANPADYMLECVSPASGDAIHDWTTAVWDKCPQKEDVVAMIRDQAVKLVPEGTMKIEFDKSAVASRFIQLKLLMKRASLSIWRDPVAVLAMLFIAIFAATLTALMFTGKAGDTSEGARYTQTAIFAQYVQAPIFFIYICLPGIYSDRAAFYRETSSGFYKPSAYALSLQIVWLPYVIVSAVLNMTITYFAVPLNDEPGRYGYAVVLFTVFMIGCWYQGLAIGAATPNMAQGTQLATLPVISSLFFCGFMVTRDQIGWWFRWLYYINPAGLTYLVSGAFKNEFSGRTFIEYPDTGEAVLESYGWQDDRYEALNKWECAAIVAGIALVWMLLGQAAFHIRHGTR